ncbi:MAG: prepilin peptidase [Candidatus Aminicenantes bacterium]|nr:prepilin peptidase [Candidatus Aminicenantes bacterium]
MTILYVALFGLVWGSFLNVVIYRVPRGMNIVRPPSACPSCGGRIKPYDNIPVFSYLWLGGKCRRCRAPIGLTYPAVEALTALAFVLLHLRFGLGLHFFAGAAFASALIALGFIDAFHRVLPDAITLPGFGLGLAYALIRTDGFSLLRALLGAAVGAGFLLLVFGVYWLLRRKEGLGMGDVTMMLMVGSFLGWLPALLVIVLASLAGTVVGLALMRLRKADLQSALPYGTFLAPAAFVVFVWGETLLRWYLSLFRRP